MIRRIIRAGWRCKKIILRRVLPISAAHLYQTLNGIIPATNSILFVHSSLSSCGFIPGGPATVISALRRKCNTLVLPTHTYCYPSAEQTIGPPYDPAATPSEVGAISNWFWQQSNVVRSLHPTHSVAAIGPDASEICAGHELADTPCGSGTPYQTLIERQAAVLMFGCTMNTYTLFHTSEHLAKCPYLYYPEQVNLSYVAQTGKTNSMKMWRQNMAYTRRFEAMDQELADQKLLKIHRLRDGRLLYIPDSRAVHQYLMDRFEENPSHLLKDFGSGASG